MIIKSTGHSADLFEIQCDNCKVTFTDPEGDELFESKAAANTEAEAEGWECLRNGDHYCPNCQI